ncbi:rod-binding protein [Nitratireductor kimnyeongensis]|uniref:Rod-binding protein n=1 Tax=Nitratireductor kimnyeongensis TaxID=430679 RepID=A0ABW0T7R8_9HYPH|nr:rod-binding protein [Nitratireductor kimnyeongensis]
MAISPPGDIVLNVARAADPTKAAAAKERLQAQSGVTASFSAVFDENPVQASKANANAPSDVERKFEAMVLQNFMQSLLPEETSAVYGEGLAGEMWRSMLAQQLSETLAEKGGIGIARSVLRDYTVENEKPVPIGAVSQTPEQEEVGKRALLSTAMVEEIQRETAKTLGVNTASASRDKDS